jgi:hypothetical protein
MAEARVTGSLTGRPEAHLSAIQRRYLTDVLIPPGQHRMRPGPAAVPHPGPGAGPRASAGTAYWAVNRKVRCNWPQVEALVAMAAGTLW